MRTALDANDQGGGGGGEAGSARTAEHRGQVRGARGISLPR